MVADNKGANGQATGTLPENQLSTNRNLEESGDTMNSSTGSTEDSLRIVTSCPKYLPNSEQLVPNSDSGEPKSMLPHLGETKMQIAIKLCCNPGGSILLSLTKLSHHLARLTVKTVREVAHSHSENQPAYPILQYLDAYIAQFGNFLAHQPSLMGAFLALKLTDPYFENNSSVLVDSNKSTSFHMAPSELAERKERLRRLHNHFVRVFSEAADTVAFSASRQLLSPLIGKNVTLAGNVKIHPQEMAAANSRRAMLQDFLTWSRQFDAAWQQFQSDTWHQAVTQNRQVSSSNEKLHIAHGLNALFGFKESGTLSDTLSDTDNAKEISSGLLQLLLDAKAELCFGPQSTR